jgi:hypothetical protein
MSERTRRLRELSASGLDAYYQVEAETVEVDSVMRRG